MRYILTRLVNDVAKEGRNSYAWILTRENMLVIMGQGMMWSSAASRWQHYGQESLRWDSDLLWDRVVPTKARPGRASRGSRCFKGMANMHERQPKTCMPPTNLASGWLAGLYSACKNEPHNFTTSSHAMHACMHITPLTTHCCFSLCESKWHDGRNTMHQV